MAITSWHVRLMERAEQDLGEILDWTVENFGPNQAETYRETLLAAIGELRAGPSLLGVKKRDDIFPGLNTLPVAGHGRHGRHFVLFRVAPDEDRVVEILRLLHDSMDLARHVPNAE
jgi:toxin ParE1/3/4